MRAEHQAEQCRLRWPRAAGIAPTMRPCRITTMRSAQARHLAQLVGDEHHAIALRAQFGEGAEQALDLLRRQHLGRLVEDQHARAGEQLLEDLDLLLVADREAADRQPRIDRQAQALGEAAHAAAHVAPGRSPGQVVEKERDILPDAERRDQAEVLEHHADAQTAGVARRGDGRRRARRRGSRRRRAGNSRTGSCTACSCRRRSRRATRPLRPPATAKCATSLASSGPKRLTMPRASSSGAAAGHRPVPMARILLGTCRARPSCPKGMPPRRVIARSSVPVALRAERVSLAPGGNDKKICRE